MKKIVCLWMFILCIPILYAQNVPTITIPKHIPETPHAISHFFDSIEYIPLETTDECLIDQLWNIQLIEDKFILIFTTDNCFLFDRLSGKFIRKIGEKGNHPQGYGYTQSGHYNPYTKYIYLKGWNQDLVIYDLEGEFIQKVNIPMAINGFNSNAGRTIYLNGENLCCFFPNLIGNQTKRVLIFNHNEEIIKLYNNTELYENKSYLIRHPDELFYDYNSDIYFKERFNDTIYHVSTQNLTPHFVVKNPSYSIPYSERYDPTKKTSNPNPIFENDQYIFLLHLSPEYSMIYSKEDNKPYYFKSEKGIKDDLHGYMPIKIVTHGSAMTPDGTLICSYPAHELWDFLEKNKNPNLPYINMLKKVQPEDNPVLLLIK